MRRILLFPLLLYSVLCNAEIPLVAVASNLTAPMTEIVNQFKTESGLTVRTTFGSSGNLSRQIVQGAPFHIFISASYDYVGFLLAEAAIDDQGTELVQGRIGIFIPEQSTLNGSDDLSDVINLLKYGYYRKIAMANPEHAPYGVAAMQSLQSAGLWAIASNRTLLADSVAQVMQFALSGNIDAAVIPYSFMHQELIKGKGTFLLIPQTWHEPVNQYVVLLRSAGQVSRQFNEFLYSDSAREIFDKYGYTVADE